MKTNVVQDRLWQTQLELIQVCYRNRLSQPLKNFIAGRDFSGVLIYDETMALDPEIRHRMQFAYNQIYNRGRMMEADYPGNKIG